jgi:hypothetical protein
MPRIRSAWPTPAGVLTEDFVLRYLDRLDALGFPPGKLTIDHG